MLWLVHITTVVEATDERRAHVAATLPHVRHERADVTAKPITSVDQLPPEWGKSVPWGAVPPDFRTCEKRLRDGEMTGTGAPARRD